MRILAVCNLFPPYVMGGNELRFRSILERLSERHTVQVLTSVAPQAPSPASEPWISRSLRQTVPYPRPKPRRRGALLREWYTTIYNHAATREVVRRFQPDVAYLSDTKRIHLGPAFAIQDRGVPIVWDVTDESLRAYWRRLRIRRRLPLMDPTALSFRYSIAISRFIRDALARREILEPHSMFLNQGIDLDAFAPGKPLSAGSPPRKLLFVGSLVPDKGLHVLIEALRRLDANARGYTLTVCGDSGNEAYKEDLHRQLREGGLAGLVRFLGRIPGDEIPQLYRDHDAFVFASVWPEPFASTPLEAMACGIPVVGTPVGGQADLFEHRKNCLLYQPEDPENLCRNVRELDDQTLRQTIVRNAYEQVQRDHGLDHYVARIEQTLERAARDGTTAR